LRTPYRDLASQIETLTPDFMEDFALNSIEEAVMYTINVESRDEYVINNGISDHSYNNLRIRGLSDVPPTRFFFRSLMPADQYNLNRIDISSGPNTILFGTRLHTGVVNSEPGSAVFSNQGSISTLFDSNGTVRIRLDFNQVLSEDTLAVRAAVLYENYEWETQPSSELDRRFYATATYKPWSKTSIRAFFENVDLKRQVPTRAFPFDSITPWYEAAEMAGSGYTENQPIFENNLEWYDSNRPIGGQQVFKRSHGWPVLVIENGNNGGISDIGTWRNAVAVQKPTRWAHVNPLNYNRGPTLLNDRYFPTDVSLITGVRQNNLNGRIGNLILNQEILPGLNLEAAGHVEELNVFLTGDIGSTVQADANKYLPDGITLNPNAGKMYVEGFPNYYRSNEDIESWRAALAYDYDFAVKQDGWAANLGRHRLVGLVTGEEFKSKAQTYYYRILPKRKTDIDFEFPEIEGVTWKYPFFYSWNDNSILTDPSASFISRKNPTFIFFRYYVDPQKGDVVPKLPFTLGQPLELIDSSGVPFTIDPENTGFVDEEGRRLATAITSNSYRTREDVIQFTYQGNFLDDRLVLTYGRRETKLKAALISVWLPDPYTGMRAHIDEVGYTELETLEPGTSETAGIVAAPFRDWLDLPGNVDLTFGYQQSSTYGTPTPYRDPFGVSYPGSHGEGEDASVRLSLPGNRFSVRLNYYKITAGPTVASFNPFQGIRFHLGQVEARIRELDPDLSIIEGPTGHGFPAPGTDNQYLLMAYVEATGYELSGHWAVTDNFQIRFNAADMKTVESGVGQEWWEWIDQRLPVYRDLDVLEGGVDNPSDVDGDEKIGQWTWETARLKDDDTQTLSDYWQTQVVHGQNGIEVIHSLDGKSNPFIRSMRFNLNGMYRFTQGRLKGLNLGAAVRWRESPLLTYGATTVNGANIADLNNPLYGVSEWYLDLVARYSFRTALLGDRTTTVSLNVRNALDRDNPIPYEMYVNGDPLRMASVEGVKFILSLKMEL